MKHKPHRKMKPPRQRTDIQFLQNTPPWDWPPNAGQIFKTALVDRGASASDRLIAAELAGDLVVMDDEIADVLLTVVRNAEEPAELRTQAAISFGPVLEQTDIEGFDELGEPPITEHTFHAIQETLHKLYLDSGAPKLMRRRILEASIRAPEDWHREAIGSAYSSGDAEWVLTAVFAMQWVKGFDGQILQAQKSDNPEIHCEAVQAAGNWELDAAWPHVVGLIEDPATPKDLLLAAIEAAGSIRPREAGPILVDLSESDDEDIAEAASETMMMAEVASQAEDDNEDDYEDEDEDEEEGEWVN